jgi:hypothetical protein
MAFTSLIYAKCLQELYPFNESELRSLKEVLDFKHVSANRNIDWDCKLIKEFKNLWDWDTLNSNKAVFDKITLGLLFPDKVDLPQCDCYRIEEFCEYANCLINLKRLSASSELYQYHSYIYVRIGILCETGLISRDTLIETLVNNDSQKIERLIENVFQND